MKKGASWAHTAMESMSYLNHGADGLHMPLEVEVIEFIL